MICMNLYENSSFVPLEILISGIFFFHILFLVNGEVDFTLSSICLYYKYNQVDVIFQIKYTTVLQKFFFKYMEVGKVSRLFFLDTF